jgi:NADH-quinone oxidoreductase subunit E
MHTHRRYSFKNQHFVGEEGRLIPLLQHVQAEDGYLRPERLKEIHEQSGIPMATIYGVATFYAQFRLKPVGKHLLRVCHGTACHVSGAVETVSCLGCCSLAPAMMINAATFGNLSPSSAVKVVKKFQKGERS